jgi:subtilase family serine protease
MITKARAVAAVAAAAGLFTSIGLAAPQVASASSSSSSGRAALAGSEAPASARAHPAGGLAAGTPIHFEMVLALRDPAGAAALVRAVSDPASPSFRHYVTAAQWEARFSPTPATVGQVRSWLSSEGFSVGPASADRITVPATGTVAQVEKAFGTTLGYYSVQGHRLIESSSSSSVPASLAGTVSGVLGLNQTYSSVPAAVASTQAATPAQSGGSADPPPPAAFVTAPPCSYAYGAKTTATTFDQQYPGYPSSLPDVVCGYVGHQLRSAYNIPPAATGAGQTIAIVDAYDSATIASDAQRYFAANDPSAPFSPSQFTQIDQGPFANEAECDASGWQDEEAIDIESAHSLAPKANIVYVGASDCINGLFNAEQYVVDNGLANVVTNSWGDTAGDLLDDAATHTAYDDVFELADSTGITVQFSSGDQGDNFDLIGISAADYPASSPFVTAVGGTTLQIGPGGQQLGSYGWYTGRSVQCEPNTAAAYGCTKSQYGQWLAPTFDGGSGGFTSYYYAQPFYQAKVVPNALATRNEAIDGPSPTRVVPDISLDADPGTGFLIGLTETFADGSVHYGQTRYGGTSLASPILAGIVADANQLAGVPVGFLNPVIYKLDTTSTTAIADVLPAGDQAQYRNDYASEIFGGKGVLHSVRVIDWSGTETYCDTTGNCESRPTTQVAAPGYDSLTGLGTPGVGFVTDVADS